MRWMRAAIFEASAQEVSVRSVSIVMVRLIWKIINREGISQPAQATAEELRELKSLRVVKRGNKVYKIERSKA